MGGHINQYPRKELIEPNTKVNQAYFYEKAPSKTRGLNPTRRIHEGENLKDDKFLTI